MTEDKVAAARHWFAEELRHVARLRSPAVVRAFATVPREHFAGQGPWRLLSPWYLRDYWTTEDADPRHLYHDVLIAIDEARRLNNGQPSLWAFLYDQLDLSAGEHVVHVGIGAGYYSAILADIVGRGARSPRSRSTRHSPRGRAPTWRSPGRRPMSSQRTASRTGRSGRPMPSSSMPA